MVREGKGNIMTLSQKPSIRLDSLDPLVLPSAETSVSDERDLLYQWLMGESGHISLTERDDSVTSRTDGKIRVYTVDEYIFDPLRGRNLLVSPQLSDILTGLIHDARKIEVSFPVESGGRPHSHVVRLTRNDDETVLITTEDQERAGVRPDGDVLSVITQGHYCPETHRCSRILRTFVHNCHTTSNFPDEENPITMAALYLWHALSVEKGATVKLYPQDGGRALMRDIKDPSLPKSITNSLQAFWGMIGQFVEFRERVAAK